MHFMSNSVLGMLIVRVDSCWLFVFDIYHPVTIAVKVD